MATTVPGPAGSLSAAQLELIPAPACVRNEGGRFLAANRHFTAALGLTVDELVGRYPVDVFDPCPASMRPRSGAPSDRASDGAGDGAGDDVSEVVLIGVADKTHRFIRQASVVADEPDGPSTVIELFTATAIGGVFTAIEAAHQAERDALRNLVNSDALTGAASRRAFEALMPDLLIPDGGGLIVVDFDHFKKFNDRYGHSAGDAALVHFVHVVQRVLRDRDLVARIGGEEFTIVVPGTSASESLTIAERIRSEAEENPVVFESAALPFTVSVGMRHVAANEEPDLAAWVSDADRMLYEAKRQGRNRVAGFGEVAKPAADDSSTACFSAIRQDGPLKMAELKAAAQLLRLVLDHIPQAVFWKDRDSVYLGCNANFAHRAGLTDPDDIVGLNDFQLPWAESDAPGFVEWDRRIVESGQPEIGILEQVLEADGSITRALTSKLPLFDADGTVVGVLGTSEDITTEEHGSGAEIGNR